MSAPRPVQANLTLPEKIESVRKRVENLHAKIDHQQEELSARESQHRLICTEIDRLCKLSENITVIDSGKNLFKNTLSILRNKTHLNKPNLLEQIKAALDGKVDIETDVAYLKREIVNDKNELQTLTAKLQKYEKISSEKNSTDAGIQAELNQLYPNLKLFSRTIDNYINDPKSHNIQNMKNLRARLTSIIENEHSPKYSLTSKWGAVEELHIFLTTQLAALKAKKILLFYPSSAVQITQDCLKLLPDPSYLREKLELMESQNASIRFHLS